MPVYGIATAEPKIQPTKVMVVNQGSNPGSIASSISNLVTTSGLTLASWLGWVNPTPAPITTHPVIQSKSKIVTENPVPAKENPHRSRRVTESITITEESRALVNTPGLGNFNENSFGSLDHRFAISIWGRTLDANGTRIPTELWLSFLTLSSSGDYRTQNHEIMISRASESQQIIKNGGFGILFLNSKAIVRWETLTTGADSNLASAYTRHAKVVDLATGGLSELEIPNMIPLSLSSTTGIMLALQGSNGLNATLVTENPDGSITQTPTLIPGITTDSIRFGAVNLQGLKNNSTSFFLSTLTQCAMCSIQPDNTITSEMLPLDPSLFSSIPGASTTTFAPGVISYSARQTPPVSIRSQALGQFTLICNLKTGASQLYDGITLGPVFTLPPGSLHNQNIIEVPKMVSPPQSNHFLMYNTVDRTSINIAHLSLNSTQKTIEVESTFTISQSHPETSEALNLSPLVIKDPNGDAEVISFSCAQTNPQSCQVDAYRLNPLTHDASLLGHLELPDVESRTSRAMIAMNNNKIQMIFPNGASSNPLETRVFLLQYVERATSTSTQRPSTATTTPRTASSSSSSSSSSSTRQPTSATQNQGVDAVESSSSKDAAILNTTSIAGIIVAGVIVVAGVIIGVVICKRGDKKTHPTMLVVTQAAFDQMLGDGSVVNPKDLKKLRASASLNGLPTSKIHQQRTAVDEEDPDATYQDISNVGPGVRMASHPSFPHYEEPVPFGGHGYLQVSAEGQGQGPVSNPTYDTACESYYDPATLKGLDVTK